MEKCELEKIRDYLLDNAGFSNFFGDYGRIYNMTTENIYGFLKKYDLKGKSVLSVGGSGDQRLNAYLLGASSVKCFDKNPFVKYHMELKDNAIKRLSYEEFLKFFGMEGNFYSKRSLFESDLFYKVIDGLSTDAYDFFNLIYSEFMPKDIYFQCADKATLEKMNGYFNEEEFNRLKEIIKDKDVDFFDSDITMLPKLLKDNKFDFILLSNISDYIHNIYGENPIKQYRDLIERLTENLNMFGLMQVAYIYSRYSIWDDVSNFRYSELRSDYFRYPEFNAAFVDSYYNDGTYDKIITYQKIK